MQGIHGAMTTCRADIMRLTPWRSPSRDKEASTSGYTALTCTDTQIFSATLVACSMLLLSFKCDLSTHLNVLEKVLAAPVLCLLMPAL